MTDIARLNTGAAPWDRIEATETPLEHEQFMGWLMMRPRPRPSDLGPHFAELSAARDWLARAQAHDQAELLKRLVPDGDPRKALQVVIEIEVQRALLAANKLYREELCSTTTRVKPAEISQLLKVMGELTAMFRQNAGAEEWDTSDCTPEEMAEVARITAKWRRKTQED